MELTYTKCGDYLIPNLVLSDTKEYHIGKYGRLRRAYLKEHRPILYTDLIVIEKLFSHLEEIDTVCRERLEIIEKAIAAMEQSLKRLEEQEQKYSAELDATLNEYAGLREQAQDFDPVQLYEAKQVIRPGKEQEAENRAQQVYGEKYNPLLMFDSKKAVSRMLNESAEERSVREKLQIIQRKKKSKQYRKTKHNDWER